jgi:hypothetical protein
LPNAWASASSITGWSFTASRSTAIARSDTPSSTLIAAARLSGLLGLFIVSAPLHVATKALLGRSGWPRRFLSTAARLCGARVRVTGEPLQPHTLLVCNHVSWLDIPVLGGATGCAFVSKEELGHPLVHWMADQGPTLYVRRDHRRGAPGQAQAIARRLEDPQPLALFPKARPGRGCRCFRFAQPCSQRSPRRRRESPRCACSTRFRRPTTARRSLMRRARR